MSLYIQTPVKYQVSFRAENMIISTREEITVSMVTYENHAFRCLSWNDLVF